MKISKSKQELASIISENGGWRDGEFAAQDKDGDVFKFYSKPVMSAGCEVWLPTSNGAYKLCCCATIKGWHQTILSRAEYFHLYPAPDAKPEFCESVMRSIPEPSIDTGCIKIDMHGDSTITIGGDPMTAIRRMQDSMVFDTTPTIEQLAADYRNAKDYADSKHKEADAARSEADAALERLYQAGLEIGIDIAIASDECESEPELVITDWRDLLNGDMVVITGSDNPGWKSLENQELKVRIEGDSCEDVYFGSWCMSNNTEWLFIRRT